MLRGALNTCPSILATSRDVLYLHYNVEFTFMKILKQNVLFPKGLNRVQR